MARHRVGAPLSARASARARASRAALLVCLSLAGCQRNHVVVYAPPDLAGAPIYLDGKSAGHFEDTVRNYRWVGWKKLRKEVSLPPRSETFARLDKIEKGTHELRIEKDGLDPVVQSFMYAGGKLEIEIPDRAVKKRDPDTTKGTTRPPA